MLWQEPDLELAPRLGRTPTAVTGRRNKLGIPVLRRRTPAAAG
jgi:hypothetical protein